MGIGASIFLIAVGAVMAFALEARVGWLDLTVVGWILMLAGLGGLLLTLTVFNRRRTVVRPVSERTVVDTPTERRVVEPAPERRVVDEQRTRIEYEDVERPL